MSKSLVRRSEVAQRPQEWTGPQVGTKCAQCEGEVWKGGTQVNVAGGLLPIPQRKGQTWYQTWYACDCLIGYWRKQILRIKSASEVQGAPQGLSGMELRILLDKCGSGTPSKTLAEAAEKLQEHEGREKILRACQDAERREQKSWMADEFAF